MRPTTEPLGAARGLRFAALALTLLFVAGPGIARAQEGDEPRAPRAIAYAMWDQELLFLAAKVDDVNLIGTATTALSEAWRDDAVDFYLDMSGGAGEALHPACARVVVSVASGFTVLVGTPGGAWRAQPDWLVGLKLGVQREGTLNRPDDLDVGYTVEVGIPWRFLGGPPQPGQRIGFNFVVHIRGENETFVSWSSRARTPEDLDRPRRWGTMVFSPAARPSVAADDVLVSPRTYTPPLVDGRLGASEWLTASVVQLDKPPPEITPERPVVGKPAGRLLATYRYDYHPGAEGADMTAFAHQPLEGLGPWFSADSVAWHVANLRQAREAAIDTILPIYPGDPGARSTRSRLGLLRLAQALKDAREGRASYPLVGMYLDAGSLPAAGVRDLTSPQGRQALWGMIAEFFTIIPADFRAQFDVDAGLPAHLLVLGPPQGLEQWDASVIDYCRERFQRTFGARLLVLGDEGWRAQAANLDGYCSLAPGVAMHHGRDGPRSIVRISPGYVGRAGVAPRDGGRAYERDWMNALALQPDFIIIDSLNDFQAATEIAASRQFGVQFLDATRQFAHQLAGRREFQIAIRRSTLPPVLNQGATHTIEFLLENRGFQDLTAAQNVEISYTLQNQQRPTVRRTGIAAPRLFVPAGQRAPILAEISTRTVDGPLPVGDYQLTFEVTKSAIPLLRSRWFATRLFEVSLPVRIDRVRSHQAAVLATTTPAAIGAGARQRVRLRLRNDGARAWRARDVALTYRWLRGTAPGAGPVEPQVIETQGIRTPLPRDVEPGAMVIMYAEVEARRADGSPLPPWTPDDDWNYYLQWDLVEGTDRWFSRLGGDTYVEAVAVLASDLSPTVVDVELPTVMEAGASIPVKAVVRNDGSAAWEAGREKSLAYRWYFWDGAPTGHEIPQAPLPAVGVGEAALVATEITAPDSAGAYRLALDFIFDGRPVSETTDAGSRRIRVQPVSITGGAFQPLDLSEHTNTFASTFAGYGTRGAFDPAGTSFPAEHLPPDAGVRIEHYPGIYFGAAEARDALARVPLRYPAKDLRGGPAVACRGQQVPLPGEPLRAIYIAAAANVSLEADFTLVHPDGNQVVGLRIPSWREVVAGLPVAVQTPFVRGTQQDLPGEARIYLLRIADIAPDLAPTALVLPDAPQVRVFAITVERAPALQGGQ